MPEENCSVCPVCSVTIEGNTVHFAHGGPGTRDRLYARVCQYAIASGKAECINTQKPSQTALHTEGWGYASESLQYDLGRLGLDFSDLEFSVPTQTQETQQTTWAMVLGCIEAHLRSLAEALAALKGLA